MGRILLTASYVIDWVVLIAAAGVGYVLGNISPNHRAFHLEDPDISFPFSSYETITTSTLIIASLLAPAAVLLLLCLVIVPGNKVPKGVPRTLVWKRKLWELHAAWLGLAFAVATSWFIVSGMKNLFGKPRPDMLGRCNPDIANIAQYVVGGVQTAASDGRLVSSAICQVTDSKLLDEGFRSFPSGHSSTAASGLLYLSLVLASKFATAFPFLTMASRANSSAFSVSSLPASGVSAHAGQLSSYQEIPMINRNGGANNDNINDSNERPSIRKQGAAPPLYLFALVVAPFFAAIFIASTRWYNYKHHGFDILFGFLIGTVTAIFAFRYYHMPLRGGAGWAWAPRDEASAFWLGLGNTSYTARRAGYVQNRGDEEAGF